MAVLEFTVIRVYDTFVFKIYAEPSTYLVLIADCILKKNVHCRSFGREMTGFFLVTEASITV